MSVRTFMRDDSPITVRSTAHAVMAANKFITAAKGAEIILVTDQWVSPVSKYTKRVFSSKITVTSAWDSSVTTLLLLETIIAQVQQATWPETRSRMQELEAMFDDTKFFRKFT